MSRPDASDDIASSQTIEKARMRRWGIYTDEIEAGGQRYGRLDYIEQGRRDRRKTCLWSGSYLLRRYNLT